MVSEFIIKLLNRVIGIAKILDWKLLYGNRLSVGFKTFFYPGCHMMIERNASIYIGNNCFFNRNCSLTSLGKIRIGDDCIFGEGVKIYDHNHNTNEQGVLFRKQGYKVGKVEIGSNVWIGSNVIILPNVSIGNNVVIAAGSIVTKNIPNNVTFIQKRKSMEVPNGKE